jgi:flagellar motor switch protein FliG
MTRVVRRSFANLEKVWGNLLPLQVRDAELETNPEYMKVAKDSDLVILVVFEVNSQHASGLIRLCYPFETLGPALKVLKVGGTSGGGALSAQRQDSAPSPMISVDDSLEEIARKHPVMLAGAVEGLLADPGNTRGAWKASVMIACLPQHVTRSLIHQLSSGARERLTKAADDLEAVTAANRDEVFAEVKGRLVRGDYVLQGAAESAKRALDSSGSETGAFYLLRNVEANQIVPFISKEHPQSIALILSQLESTQAAGVLNGLSTELQADVVYRIGQMRSIAPEVLRELETNLAQELATLLTGRVTEVGGPKAVAEILNRTGRSTEKSVLERIDKQDPEFGERVRNQMFVFDDIANLTDKERQLVMKEIPEKDLAIGLKGANDALKDRVFSNLGEKAAEVMREEMTFSGPVRMSDVEAVQLTAVAVVRRLEKEGKITIVGGDSDDKFV